MGKLLELIEQQQKGHETKPRYMIGEQLKEMAAREPHLEELLEQDLQTEGMTLAKAEAKLQEYADQNRKGAKVFCITPATAEKILREFYGLPEAGEEPAQAAPAPAYIDLSEFL